MVNDDTSTISEYMLNVLNKYNKIRGKVVDPSESLFWDAIIISAGSADQEVGYKMHISEKQKRGEVPLSVPFHIFSDPPGYKIGCGGSTMYILEKLFEIYKSEMYEMRFLFIPAGGYSQRLPNLSVTGKLFSPLPFGENRYQMIDLILACYIPFLKSMPPGVFLVSSDAIISYSLSDSDCWTFENEGFTALAHPSPVIMGTTHGVYVLPMDDHCTEKGSTFMSECLQVLQKPTVEEMQDKGAIVKKHSIYSSEDEADLIFSDSAFFFDHTISRKLMKFYKANKPLTCEISSYGDFLQPLGSCASPAYIVDTVTSEKLASVRSSLYREFFGTKLSILILKNSNFHHLGTMEEYLDNLRGNSIFSNDFPVSSFSFSIYSCQKLTPFFIEGTVIHSIIHPLSIVPKSSILEYCDLNVALNIGKNCIISHVQLHGLPVERLPLNIPDNTLLHTLILNEGFVTVAFNVHDDIKKAYERKDIPEFQFLGRKLKSFLKCDDPVFDPECDNISLWNVKLFPVCSSPSESLKRTLEIMLCVTECEGPESNFILNRKETVWVSMGDILSIKNTEEMANYVENLCEKISSLKTK